MNIWYVTGSRLFCAWNGLEQLVTSLDYLMLSDMFQKYQFKLDFLVVLLKSAAVLLYNDDNLLFIIAYIFVYSWKS